MEKLIRIDDNLNSYQSFFDHEWSRNLEKIAQHTKLDTPVFELSTSWKGVANVRRMPWLMVDSIKNFGDSLLKAKTPLPLKVLDMVVARISSTSKDNYFRHLSTMQQNTLTKVIRESQDEAIKALEENPVTVNQEDLWKGLLQSTEIQLTLWMSEMTAYAGVYFAYEAFLIKSMKIALGLSSLRSGDRKHELAGKLKETFGDVMTKQCWADREIEKARLIRHAITHAGCKMIDKLNQFKDKDELLLEGDDIIIMSHQTNELYDLLKERVSLFSREIVKMPSMTR